MQAVNMLSSVVALGRTRWWSHHRSEGVLGRGYRAGGGKSAVEIPIRMKHINLMLMAMLGLMVVEAQALPTLPTVAGKSDQQLTVSATGELRDFTISVPAGFAACYAAQTCTPHQFPLIILLHGRGQDSAKALSWFESGTEGNVNYLTSKEAFFVAPLALPTRPNGPTLWRQITPPHNYVTDAASYADVHFIKELVDHIVGDYQPGIDPKRVYLFGFSSGAGMTWHMLCFQHRQFRSFAAVSQAIQDELNHCGVGANNSAGATSEQLDVYLGFPTAQKYGISNGAPAQPVIYMHGTAESNLDPDPSTGLQKSDPAATVDTLIALNNTVNGPTQIMNYLDDQANATYTTRYEYVKVAGSRGKAMIYYEIHNGDHSVSSLNVKVPNGCGTGTTPGVDCAHNTDYSAADEAWAFWNTAAGLNLP